MVEGLLPKDFTVYENGVRQKLTYFTSDPLGISAAVLIDVSMSDTALRKVQDGLQALQGAFTPPNLPAFEVQMFGSISLWGGAISN